VMLLNNIVGTRAVALVASTSLLAATACHTSCRRGASGDRPAALGPAASLASRHPPSPSQPSLRSPPIPQTCWDRAKTPEETDECGEAEFQGADRTLNAVYAQVLADADPNLRSAIRSAERAWLRYRDAYLSSLAPGASGSRSQAPVDHCRSILLTRVTRGRVAELTRMLPRGNRETQAVEASCEGPPVECEQAYQRLEAAYRRVAGSSQAAVRARLDASQGAWLGYLAAQTAAVLALQRTPEPSLRARVRESVHVRLSLDRIAHLATFDEYRKRAEERCQELQTETKMLAEQEAQCGSGVAGS